MKYSKAYKHSDGFWYILNGTKKFLIDTKSEIELEAKEKGAAKSAAYYLTQAKKALSGCKDLIANDQDAFNWVSNADFGVHAKIENADRNLQCEIGDSTDQEYYPWWA